MGEFKPLIPWPGPDGARPLIRAVCDRIDRWAASQIVVAASHAPLAPSLVGVDARLIHAPPDGDMSLSIRTGLAEALQADDWRYVLLQPGDHPHVRDETLMRLFGEAALHPARAIMPTFDGRGGHPVLIPRAVVDRILASPSGEPLRELWRREPELSFRTACDDPWVICDIDTPADVREAVGRYLAEHPAEGL